MHHGGHGEDEIMLAERQGVTLFNGLQVGRLAAKELLHHLRRFGGADHSGLRETEQQRCYQRAVVGLHVVNDKIVEMASIEGDFHVLEELFADGKVGGVQQGGLLVEQHVAVVRHPTRDGVDVLEEGRAAVAHADINEVVVDGLDVMHNRVVFVLFEMQRYGFFPI